MSESNHTKKLQRNKLNEIFIYLDSLILAILSFFWLDKMGKLSKSGNQYRITIPREIIILTKWNENTEIMFLADLKKPNSKFDKDTPIFIRKIGGKAKEKKKIKNISPKVKE